ncbi:myb-like protein X [Ptychodera flava]|uniref:myb-like protein X n=1 Tax=Ptychodera flava TaxID=63121 RepID=UPI00396A5B4A
MAHTVSEALLVSTSWNTASQQTTLVKDFCDPVSKLYCTVLDVEVSEDQKKDAESVGVTLIPATRSKWLDPDEDPPGVNWLVHHDKYYPQLKDLLNIKHVVSFSLKTHKAAAAIHTSLFYEAKLHQLSPPERNGVLFTFDVWSKNACGLAGYHRSIIQDFCVRKGRTGELLKAYSTVLDVKLTEDQEIDAEKCHVTLIPAQKKKRANQKKDLPKLEWLMEHQSRYPDLGKLENIKYVVGYAPKTGRAAADIRETLFPDAKLVLINHACPEKNCLLENGDDEDSVLEDEMLEMASVADMLFSIGPTIYEYFQNAYRAKVDGRQLSDIPHEEILPKPGQVYFDSKPVIVKDMKAHSLLTYGQLDSLEAVTKCTSIASAVGTVANNHGTVGKKVPEWKICGVSTKHSKEAQKILTAKMQSEKVQSKLYPASSASVLLRSIQQSHLCLPPSCYTDYSFEGLEAMAAGLPTTVQDDSHIAGFISKYFKYHEVYSVTESENLAAKITLNLTKSIQAFEQAMVLKDDLLESAAVAESFANFASLFKEEKVRQKHNLKEEVKEERQRSQQKEVPKMSERGDAQYSTLGEHEMRSKDKIKPEIHPEMTATTHKESTLLVESSTVQSQMSSKKDAVLKETTAGKPGESATDCKEITDTTAVEPGESATDGKEITDTTAGKPGESATDCKEITDTTAVKPAESVTNDKEITVTTAVPARRSIMDDVGTAETKAVQPGSSATVGQEITDKTAKHRAVTQVKETKKTSIFQRYFPVFHRRQKNKGESKTKSTMQWKREKSIGEGKLAENVKNPLEESDNAGQIQQTLPTNKHSPSYTIFLRLPNYNLGLTVDLNLKKELYDQQLRTVVDQGASQNQSRSELDNTWRYCNNEFDKKVEDVIASEASQQTAQQLCQKNCGEVTTTKFKSGSLKISLNIPTQYNLYRVRHTCKSGSFPDSFEPLLITDKMREEADKVGLQLKLKATYDQARFDELRLFFLECDGGGLEPVEIHDDIIEAEDAEEIPVYIDTEETNQKSNTVTEGVADRTPSEHRQYLEDIQSKSEVERATLERQLKDAKKEKDTLEERFKELTQKLKKTEKSLVSQPIERKKLQSELGQKNKLIKQLQGKVTEVDHKKEQSDVYKPGEKGDGSGLKPVKVSDDVIEGKDAEEIQIDDEDTDQKSDTMITGTVDSTALEDIQSKSTLESQLKEAKEEKATLEERRKELTQKLERTEQSLVSQRIAFFSQRIGKSTEREKLQSELEEKEKLTKKLDNTVEEFKHNLEHSSQKKQAEKAQTSMPQQPPQHHHEMSAGPPTSPVVYSQAQQMPYPTDQSHAKGTITSQMIPQKVPVENQSNIQSSQKGIDIDVL